MRNTNLLLFIGLFATLISAWPRSRQGALRASPGDALFQANPHLSTSNSSFVDLRERQAVLDQSTCGYFDGDPNSPRTAGPGFNCRYDTAHALWGFCPTTVIAATDCGLAGNCVDAHACKSGCGITGTPGITTFSCTESGAGFCSSVLLTAGPDLVFSYIACGPFAITQTLLAQPTQAKSTAKSTSTSTSASAAATASTPAAPSTPSIQSKPSTSSLVAATTSPAALPSSSFTSTTSSQLSLISSSSSSSLSSSSSSSSRSSLGDVPAVTSSTRSPSSTVTTVTEPTPSGSSNLGAIIGGVIGGLAVLCVFVLGILFLRRSRRGKNEESSKRNTWWKGIYRTTEMQTAGLHEKDADVPTRHEVSGIGMYEKEDNSLKGMGSDGGGTRRYTAYELPG